MGKVLFFCVTNLGSISSTSYGPPAAPGNDPLSTGSTKPKQSRNVASKQKKTRKVKKDVFAILKSICPPGKELKIKESGEDKKHKRKKKKKKCREERKNCDRLLK